MKRLLSMTLVTVMLAFLVLSLASCSAYGKIEKSFTDAGYKVINTTDEDGNNALSFIADFEKDGAVSCTAHILKKSIGTYAVILEFGANADAEKKLNEMLTDEDFATLGEVDDKAKLIRDNCVLVPITVNIFNAEATINEMVTLFNK